MPTQKYATWEKVTGPLPEFTAELMAEKNRVIYKNTTEATLNKKLPNGPTAGVYLFFDEKKQPVYVGRSKNLQRRLGVDHRLSVRNRAALAVRLYEDKRNKSRGLDMARRRIINNYHVAWVAVADPYTRAVLEIYVALKTRAKYNTFEEH